MFREILTRTVIAVGIHLAPMVAVGGHPVRVMTQDPSCSV